MHHFILDFSSCAEVWTYLAQARVGRKVFPAWVHCKALGAPRCPWPGDTSQLLCPREWMEQSRGQFGSFPREETLGCVSPDLANGAAVSQLCHSSACLWPRHRAVKGHKNLCHSSLDFHLSSLNTNLILRSSIYIFQN